jgi:hypothetical protein
MPDALRHRQEPFTSANAFMACGAPQESGSPRHAAYDSAHYPQKPRGKRTSQTSAAAGAATVLVEGSIDADLLGVIQRWPDLACV